MGTKRKKRSTKALTSLPARKLTAKDAKAVRGGKHIAGVKYGDITVDCGSGMSKIS